MELNNAKTKQIIHVKMGNIPMNMRMKKIGVNAAKRNAIQIIIMTIMYVYVNANTL